MPGKIKVKILAGRNLPVMDRSGDTTDAYVELKFGNTTYKTDVCRKSLNPQWNSEWYRFEVDDAELQDEPLQIRLMDHDTYSANDAIGKVYINLNPLLLPGVPPPVKNIWTLEATMNSSTGSQGSVMTGWIPVYDTMHGIRGEVNIIVKVELFSDFNKFRQSSCGIQFFYSPNIPYGYRAQVIHGFVEELVVSDDPEYKWIDKIRTPRASNEARQTLFFKLSGEVQRKIGLKALDLGGNAVIGYLQNFDLEGESGIVARGIGTAVTLIKVHDVIGSSTDNANIEEIALSALPPQYKSQAECTELTDDSMPLLSHSFNRSLTFLPTNALHNKPHYCGKRQMSLQTDTRNITLRKSPLSSISLTDSLIREPSVKSMLALEDTRGQPTKSRFSKGFKSLRKVFDSVDEESDLDSSQSSARFTGSDSARSSIGNIRNFKQEKKRTSGQPAGEKMAAILIKSLYTSIPLDSVAESHVEKLPSTSESFSRYADDQQISPNGDFTFDEEYCEETRQSEENDSIDDIYMKVLKKETKSDDNCISSSETDTSFSDEESNASYAILDETWSLIDRDYYGLNDGQPSLEKSSYDKTAGTFIPPPLSEMDSFNETPDRSPNHSQNANVTSRIASKKSILPKITCPSHSQFREGVVSERKLDYENRAGETEDSSRGICRDLASAAIFDQEFGCDKGYTVSSEEVLPLAISTPTKDSLSYTDFFPFKHADPEINNPTVDQVLKMYDEDRDESSPSNETADYNRAEVQLFQEDGYVKSDLNVSIKCEEKESVSALLESEDSSVLEKKLTKATDAQKYNSLKKVERSNTVIYKGYDRNAVTTSTHSSTSLSSTSSTSNSTSPIKNHGESQQVTSGKKTVTNMKRKFSSNVVGRFPKSGTKQNERKKCMLELIKTIDTKMMVRPVHSDSDVIRNKRKRGRTCKSVSPVRASQKAEIQARECRCEYCNGRRLNHVSSKLNAGKNKICVCSGVFIENSSQKESEIRLSSSKHLKDTVACLTDRRSSVCRTAAIELTDNRENRNPACNDVNVIEMQNLQARVTNASTTLSSVKKAKVTRTVYKSCSACNLKDASDHLTFSKPTNTANITYNSCVSYPSPNHRQQDETSLSPSYLLPAVPPMVTKVSHSPATKAHIPLHRRSSDSDLSVTPKGNSLGGSDRSMGGLLKTSTAVVRTMNQESLEMLEYPFITMQQYPPGFIVHIGGLVSSRSVKLLERISNLEEPESRDSWWIEIRMEVRSHARALACNVVIGYKEETSICDDVCVLNASGTAAVINFHNTHQDQDSVFLNRLQQGLVTATMDLEKIQQKSMIIKLEKNDNETSLSQPTQLPTKVRHMSESNDQEVSNIPFQSGCNLCHLPYNESSVPFRVNISKCAVCKRAKVPDVMFTTIELPDNLPITGRGCFIQATVCKNKKDLRGELNAKEISDCLPFLEYELHSLLLNKLKVKGMNGIFGLKIQVSIGERLVIGMAVGTAVFLTSLPPPSIPQIASGNSWHNEDQLAEIRKSLLEAVKKNKEFYCLKPPVETENGRTVTTSDTDESDDDLPELDLSLGTRDACVLEVDDIEDMDRISLLMDDRPPDDFHVVNTQTIPGLEDLEIVRNLQMFTQVSRAKIPTGQFASMPSKYFARLLQSVYFKLRRMVPCALCDMQFKVALPEQDEIQITVVGMALGLGEPIKTSMCKKKMIAGFLNKDQVKKTDDTDMIFTLEDHVENNSLSEDISNTCRGNSSILTSIPEQKPRPRSPSRIKAHLTHRYKHVPLKGRYGVDITPLSYLPGGKIDRYLGNLNFFFIRESTSIRENGGLSGFTHSFVMEVLAIVRAHITALGGNAMIAFFMNQCVLLHSPHKNQGQCLINVGGDVVSVSYFANEKHGGSSNC